jgi:hypothetical protein
MTEEIRCTPDLSGLSHITLVTPFTTEATARADNSTQGSRISNHKPTISTPSIHEPANETNEQ